MKPIATTPRLHVLVSADYEVFLGRNYASDDEVLFRPAADFLDRCESLGVPLTFFADVCSVGAHRKYGLNEYADKFESQLRDATKRGCDVQLHVHPHWTVASRVADEWRLVEDKIHLSEFGFNAPGEGARAIIRDGRDYLQRLLRPVKPDYRCIAFRAAGLALQPDECRLISSLLENGFQIDSSIAKGLTLRLDTLRVDYRSVPGAANWFLDSEHSLSEGAATGLFEIPVCTFQTGLPARVLFLLRRLLAVRQQRGAGLSRSERQSRIASLRTLVLENLRYLGRSPYFLLSADTKGFTSSMLVRGLRSYVERHKGSSEIYLAMLNHPKLLFAQQLDLFAEFINHIKREYSGRIVFETYAQAADHLATSRGI